MRLSEFMDSMDFTPDFIFMDIEGFETEVIADLTEGWLARHKPVILFEIHRRYYKDGKDHEWLRAQLEANGFRAITSSGKCIARPVG